MSNFHRIAENRANQRQAEADGVVADSLEVRKTLMQEFHDGKKTLEEVQKELSAIKRAAKKNGKITRNQAYTGRC